MRRYNPDVKLIIALLTLSTFAACGREIVRPGSGDLDIGRPLSVKRDLGSPEVAFDAWRLALSEGEGRKAFPFLSGWAKSEWLYHRMEGESSGVRAWRDGLPEPTRMDLDLWYGFCKKHRERLKRAEVLPPSVLDHPSIPALFEAYVGLHAEILRKRICHLKVDDHEVSATGVTVSARNAQGKIERFPMVYANGGWKIDAYTEYERQ